MQKGGLPVFLDGNIPTNVSTNQDLIMVVATSENLLFESTPRTRVLQETLSGNLTVRLQLWTMRRGPAGSRSRSR